MDAAAEPDRPTPTIENYLKAIRSLGDVDGLVRPMAIASAMGVSRPTVTGTLHRLQEAGWIERVDKQVRLTTTGLTHASSVSRRHAVAEAFLEHMLGLPHEVAVREACDLEHALSQRAVDALERRLASPGEGAGASSAPALSQPGRKP